MHKGFVQLIIMIIIAVAILSFFGISIKSLLQNEAFRNNMIFLWEMSVNIWNNYLTYPAHLLWNFITEDVWGFIQEIRQ